MTTHASSPALIAYLGPAGTFTEQAILTQPDLAAANHVLCRSHSDVLFRTQDGETDMGFCAIENAIEGTVNVIQDTLAFDTTLLIQREVIIPITMNLLVRPLEFSKKMFFNERSCIMNITTTLLELLVV